MALKDEVAIYARVKTDEDEYKDQLLANISKTKEGKLNILINSPPALKDILKECGVDLI